MKIPHFAGGKFPTPEDHEWARALQEAIRLKPDHANAWYNLGVTYRLQGNRSKVMEVYQTLKTLDQNRADKFFQKVVLPWKKKK